jgi:phenylpyruvate tautomerase PptA (4-oxalocrotonate tautomerase family)
MPAYHCTSPAGTLTDTMKSEVATAITDAHVAATGGPREFVRVFFAESPRGAAYSGGQLDTDVSMITGTIRAGRPVQVKRQLIKTITDAWSQITGQPVAQLVAAIAEIAPEAVMEFGLFLPAAGDEDEWFRANSAVLQAINDV